VKKIIACLSFVIFSTALWAVWEGNAGVGAARDFTSGSMLVRSDMFPRDTFIEIENLENGKKTTALVSGSSGIAGLLVNMSPEVAKVLDVPSDKIVRVRINTTTKLSDDFLAESDYTTSDADYNPSLAVTTAPETPAPAYDESDTVLFDPASLKNYPKSVQPKPSETVAKKEPEVEPMPEPVSEPAETEPQTGPEAVAVNNEPEPVTEPQPEVKPLNNEKAYLEKAGLKPPKSKNDGSAATKTETVTTTTTKTVTTETYTEPVVEKPAETAPVTPQVQPATTKPEAETKPVSTVGGVTQPATSKPEAETKPVSTVGGVTQPATTKPEAETKPVSTVGGITQPATTKPEAETKPVSTVGGITQPATTKPEAETKPVSTVGGVTQPATTKPEAETKPVSTVGGVTQPATTKPEAETKPVSTVGGVTQPETTKPEAETKPVATVGGITQPATSKPEAETKPVSTVGGITQPATSKPEAETKPVATVGGVTQPENTKTEEMAAAAKPVEIAPTKKSSEITKPAAKPVEVKTIETTKTTTAVTVIEEPEQTIAQNSKKTPIIEVPSIGNLNSMKIEPYIVQADSQMYAGSLQKGKYYLQIANYSKEANAQSILAKYKKYPLAIEKLGSGTRTRYRVFIGPLKIDEMGAVMEQFNKFGFTDSFFKVIQ